jgi:predicted amidohydrolase
MARNHHNLVPNFDFSQGQIGQLPTFWEVRSPKESLAPHFELTKEDGANVLIVCGNGNENNVGCLYTPLLLAAGKTYRMKVQFHISDDVNPYENLLFSFYSKDFNNGIFHFKSSEGYIEGENKFFIPGEGEISGEVQIYFRMSGNGKARIRNIALEECASLPPRNVKVACVQGTASLENWGGVLDYIGQESVDLVLLPETFRSTDYNQAEPIDGPSAKLMSQKAKQYNMHVAGTFYHKDKSDAYLYNTGLVFGRNGELIGRYDKNHLFSPELLEGGVIPGSSVPVFDTDFGKIGMMICYDSWFTDVAELLALRGAEIILFPSAGYYESIMPARAADNGVRIIASSLGSPAGIWDTSGAEARNPNADGTRHANCENTFSDFRQEEVLGINILFANFDLDKSPSPHNWGGPMRSAPGGRRNRREQKNLLLKEIQSEIEKW